jgi:PKD repeat protein
MPKPGISIFHNTVTMGGLGVFSPNSGSVSMYVGGNVKGGIALVNNILGNTSRPTSTNTGTPTYKVSVYIGGTVSPFTPNNILGSDPINNNNYFSVNKDTLATSPVNNLVAMFGSVTAPTTVYDTTLIRWRQFTLGDGLSFTWPNKFLTDSTPNVELISAGLTWSSGQFNGTICSDIYGTVRFGCPGFSLAPAPSARDVGAVEFAQPYPALLPTQTYLINGVQDPPIVSNPTKQSSFSTVRKAVDYLNSQGVDGSFGGSKTINLVISSGYAGETDTFFYPITVLDYPRMNPNRTVILSLASGRNDTIQYKGVLAPISPSGNNSVIRFSGARFFTIDGSNNGSSSRNLTFMLPASFTQTNNKVIDFIPGLSPSYGGYAAPVYSGMNPGTSNITIKNCNIIGNTSGSTILTYAGVYLGGGINLASPALPSANALYGYNGNNTISNNMIGGVKYGVYLRGTPVRGMQDVGNVVDGNDIGSSSTANAMYSFGGDNNIAGIFACAQTGAMISNNNIRNNMPGSFTAPRGIELGTVAGAGGNTVLDSATVVSANTIYNIKTSSNAAYGIYVNYGSDTNNVNRNNTLVNNMISGIEASGSSITSTTTFIANPFGIAIDATANMKYGFNTNSAIAMYFNSVNLGSANTLTTSNSASAALGIAPQILGGVISIDNIFQNKLGGTGRLSYGVLVGGATSPFSRSDFNDYWAGASAGTNYNFGYAGATTPVNYMTWDDIMTFTKQDTSSITFRAPFTNDTNLFIPSGTGAVIYQSGTQVSGYPLDKTGITVRGSYPTLGAHEYDNGSYTDSVAPRIFNASDLTQCFSGPVLLTFRLYDRLLTKDTFYYKVNGGSVLALQALVSTGTYPALRTYLIPQQPSSSIIEYRVSGRDFSSPPNVGSYPLKKLWDTLNTNINAIPYVNTFEGANNPVWTVQSLSNNGTWQLGAFGSVTNPSLGAREGAKVALFPSATLPAGASARLVSPCFDFSNLKSPTMRFFVSQNSANPTKRDSIAIKVSAGGNFFSNPLKSIVRVNTSPAFYFPNWMMVEVCLSDYAGVPGVKVAFEAYAAGGGQNLMIDSIAIFDDVQMQALTPKISSQCFRDSVTLVIPNTDSRFLYSIVNEKDNSVITARAGNDGSLPVRFLAPPSDTLIYHVNASNMISVANGTSFGVFQVTCQNVLPDTMTVYVNRFYNGPLVVNGTPFTGAFNAGNAQEPDAGRPGDTLTYQLVPPGSLTNSDYGTKWAITSAVAKTIRGTSVTNIAFTAPSSSNAGYVTIKPITAELDSIYYIDITFRLYPTNCDSTVRRILRVANAPLASFVYTPTDTICQYSTINFLSTSNFDYNKEGPITYLWLFGDNFTSGVVNPPHAYQTPGAYNVTLIVSNRFGLSTTVSHLINVLAAPIVSYSNTTPCTGDSTVFTPTGAQDANARYLWTFPGNTTSTNMIGKFVFMQHDTFYNVTLKIQNPNGCSNSQTRSFYAFSKPTANFSTAPHCLGVPVPVTNMSSIVSGNFGSYWYWGNGHISLGDTPVYRYDTSGTYSVKLRVVSSFGCVDSVVKTVTVYDKPRAAFSYSNACQGDRINIVNNSTFSGGINNIDYLWDFGDNDNLTPNNVRTPNKSYSSSTKSNLSQGSPYALSLLVVDRLNGCRDSFTRYVDVYPKPVASINVPSASCVNSQVLMLNQSYTLDKDYFTCFWDFGDANTSAACGSPSPAGLQVTKVYSAAGTYTVKLIVTTGLGSCMDTDQASVTIASTPALSFSKTYPQYQCHNRGHYTPNITSSHTQWKAYRWQNPNGPAKPAGDTLTSVQFIGDFIFNSPDTFEIQLTLLDSNGCTTVFKDTTIVYCGVGVQEQLADKFELKAYPNPFANSANVSFTLEKAATARITVMDILGRVVKTNELGRVTSGKHEFVLDDTNFNSSSGTYMIRVDLDDVSIYKTMIRQQ